MRPRLNPRLEYSDGNYLAMYLDKSQEKLMEIICNFVCCLTIMGCTVCANFIVIGFQQEYIVEIQKNIFPIKESFFFTFFSKRKIESSVGI